MVRRNGRPTFDTLLWLTLLCGSGVLAFLSLGTWWFAVPAFALFGALWGGSSDARWHENGHGTAFRSQWANDAMYHVASFMLLREPTLWRWSHARHHSDTLIVGLDPEIAIERPPSLVVVALLYLHLINGPKLLRLMLTHACGRGDELTRVVVPADQFRRVVWEARVFLALLAGVVAAAIVMGTIVPLLLVGLPSFYGAWLAFFFAVTQHAGLREDVLDHRMNTRTVYINPVFRFLYLNMNYHVEHHLFPSVPYYNLPALHQEIKAYLPPPKRSMFDAYREIFHAMRMQRKDTTWEIPRFWEAPWEAVAEGGAATGNGTASALVRGIEPTTLADEETDIGPSEMLEPGALARVVIGDGRDYVLCRTLNGTYALLDGICTHGQAALSDGYLDNYILECPKHNGRFDVRTGEAVRLPARNALCTYPVSERDGRLVVRTPSTETAVSDESSSDIAEANFVVHSTE